jgi:hypothetical protein
MKVMLELAETIAEFTHDPLGCVQAIFPWGKGDLAGSHGPRAWQREILKGIGEHLQNPDTRYQPFMAAVASGHDIGKSALVGMVTKWGLSTCEDCRVMITANTGNQLRVKTQPEVAKWFRLAEDRDFWEVRVTCIDSRDLAHKSTWRADFETWSENNTEAFQGLHNRRKRIIIIFDEASGIPKPIWEAVMGVLLDEETEIIFLAFGNPTQNSGDFRECFGSQKHRWKTYQIDSRTVEGTNKAQIEKWIADYGEDSDFVRVRVRGEFPRAGSSQFIPSDVVAAARKYRAEGYGALPKVLAVDVARFGDDQTVIGLRQGRKFQILGHYRGKDTVWVANETIRFMEQFKPDATVVDDDGVGAGVTDTIEHLGYGRRLFKFHGGAPANDAVAFYNRRAEVWGSLREWLMAGAEIPDEPDVETDLTGPEYGFSNKNQIQLEKKEDMKKRGLASPDIGDCLAMTFAVKVMPKPKPLPQPVYSQESGQSWMA